MSTATREGGLYYQPGPDKGTFVAVDAEGKEIKDAPKRKPDTQPAQQPNVARQSTGVDQLAAAIASAIQQSNAKPAPAVHVKEDNKDLDDSSAVKIDDLADFLQGVTDVKSVKAMAKKDNRVTAEKIYEARIAELEA